VHISTVEKLRRRLQQERGSWGQVADAAGVSYRTLVRFAGGQSRYPWAKFLSALDNHFRKIDRQ
jgi:transcriptional regulator with XRE-family HTH domain